MIDRGSGIPVVLLPGLQGRWEWMAPAVDALAERCRLVTFSLCDEPTSGFAHDPERGIENYLTQIDEAFDRAGLDTAVLVGVSYTGPIAAEYAARRPGRVRGLVLVSALPPDWLPNARARFYLRAPRLLLPLFLVDAPTRAMPEIRAALPRLADRIRFSAGQVSRVLRAYVAPTRMAARIRLSTTFQFGDPSRISQPVLVITGEDNLDRVVSPELTRRYLATIPNARHVVLSRTGHIGLLTRPAEFAEMVQRFADEISTNARRVPA